MGSCCNVTKTRGAFAPRFHFCCFFFGERHGLACNRRDIGGCMANFYRLIFLLLFSIPAFASTPAVYTWNGYPTYSAAFDKIFGDWDAANPNNKVCERADSLIDATHSQSVYKTMVGSSCASAVNTIYVNATGTCPTGNTKSGTAPNEICTPTVDCDSKKGTFLSQGYYDWGTSPEAFVSAVCDGSCNAAFDGSAPVGRFLSNGVYHYVAAGKYIYSGLTCSNPTSTPSFGSIPADTCPTGQVLGTFNGKKMCLAGGVPQNPNPAPAPKSSGSTTNTVTNPDQSTTKTTTTTNPDGSTTITSVTTQPNGNSTTSTSNTPAPTADPMDDFCKNNPNSSMCKSAKFCEENPDISICKTSVWSGGCGAFSCEGDAIQCAISREQHTRNCALFDQATPLSDLGNALGQGTDSGVAQNPANASNRQTVNLPGTLNTSKSIAAVCMPDLTVQVMSSSLVIPFSNICPYLEIMGRIVIAFSLIAAGRIISGGVA